MPPLICIGQWSCSLNILFFVLFFFVAAVARKQLENAGQEFHLIGSVVASIVLYSIIFLVTGGVVKFAFVGALVGLFVGGLVGARMFSSY